MRCSKKSHGLKRLKLKRLLENSEQGLIDMIKHDISSGERLWTRIAANRKRLEIVRKKLSSLN